MRAGWRPSCTRSAGYEFAPAGRVQLGATSLRAAALATFGKTATAAIKVCRYPASHFADAALSVTNFPPIHGSLLGKALLLCFKLQESKDRGGVLDRGRDAQAAHHARVHKMVDEDRQDDPDPAEWLDIKLPNRITKSLGPSARDAFSPGFFSPPDPQVRSTPTAFVDLAEGTVNHVLVGAGARGWLRTHTRWAELMGQALAARKFNAGAGGGERGYATTRLVKSADRPTRGRGRNLSLESVDDDSGRGGRTGTGTEAYANNAANAAVYARAAYTNTSADEYDLPHEDYDGDDSELEDEMFSPPPSPPGHATSTATPVLPTPSPPTPTQDAPGPPVPSPPTYVLAEAAHAARMRQMRVVLLPAFRNVVRRVVLECTLDAREGGSVADPAMRAACMSLADVVECARGGGDGAGGGEGEAALKRTRIDGADSTPTSSTPSTLSGEESAVSNEWELRRRMHDSIVAVAGFPPI
ncbi:hypothetical protein B0H11DRAFT_2227342 [Mycena galericulata]|nr:hypothetical protein B0H11DRAFT_2227342 [Mycena galericulata]